MAELNGLGHVAEMAEGVKSQYDVFVDGQLVFSKQSSGHFPELSEIVALLPAS